MMLAHAFLLSTSSLLDMTTSSYPSMKKVADDVANTTFLVQTATSRDHFFLLGQG